MGQPRWLSLHSQIPSPTARHCPQLSHLSPPSSYPPKATTGAGPTIPEERVDREEAGGHVIGTRSGKEAQDEGHGQAAEEVGGGGDGGGGERPIAIHEGTATEDTGTESTGTSIVEEAAEPEAGSASSFTEDSAGPHPTPDVGPSEVVSGASQGVEGSGYGWT